MTSEMDALLARKRSASSPRRAGHADAAIVSASLARSFWDDPVPRFFRRKDAREEEAHRTFFDFAVRRIALPGEETWISDKAEAVAVWLPPGQASMNFSLGDELAMAPLLLSVTGLLGVGRMMRLRAALDAHHPKEPHWYLMFLGVDPAFQGQGLGSALLSATLAMIDARGEAAYLESSTPENRRLYLRLGFDIVTEFTVAGGGPTMTAMWRPAR